MALEAEADIARSLGVHKATLGSQARRLSVVPQLLPIELRDSR
ncbi:hypothetical protein [Streptomyces sp. NBC_01423]